MSRLCIAGVSDVSVGYGSPQLPTLLRSLKAHYAPAEAILFEPDQSERPPRHELFPELRITRLPTRFSHYTTSGTIEYNVALLDELDRLRPDVLVLSSTLVLPALFRLRHRPRFTIYYMLESLAYFLDSPSRLARMAIDMSQRAARKIDLVLFPEENRAALDVVRAHFTEIPLAVLYNAVNSGNAASQVLPPEQRLRRLLYSGTIQRNLTFAEYFLRRELRRVPIDLYGLVEGPDRKDTLDALLSGRGQVRYRGYIDLAELNRVRKRYAFSIVSWAPTNEHQLLAAPNKFFEAIADGVPPLAAPHPQCKMILDRYDCGIVMRDWSFEAFRSAIRTAVKILDTPRYSELVENCRRAVRREISWEAQFAKVAHHLPAHL